MAREENHKIDIKGAKIDDVTMAQAVSMLEDILARGDGGYVVTPNPEILAMAQKDVRLMSAINGASLATADGIGVVYASRILKTPLPERVAGYDLAWDHMLAVFEKNGYPLFLLGAQEGVASKATENMKKKHPGLVIAGIRNGYFSDDEEDSVVRAIAQAGARAAFICLGFPKQEIFMQRHQKDLPGVLMFGLGGSLDGFAGNVKRAPVWMIKMHLEWLHRLILQPKRIFRVAKIPGFLISVFFVSIRKNKRSRVA